MSNTLSIVDITGKSVEQLAKFVLNFLVENPAEQWQEGQQLFTVCIDNPSAIIFDNDFSAQPYKFTLKNLYLRMRSQNIDCIIGAIAIDNDNSICPGKLR